MSFSQIFVAIVVLAIILTGFQLFAGWAWHRGYRQGRKDGGRIGFRDGRADERRHWLEGGSSEL